MVLFGITLVPLTEYQRDADPNLLSPLYDDYSAFDGSVERGATAAADGLGARPGILPRAGQVIIHIG